MEFEMFLSWFGKAKEISNTGNASRRTAVGTGGLFDHNFKSSRNNVGKFLEVYVASDRGVLSEARWIYACL
jgi:hypothetical protein